MSFVYHAAHCAQCLGLVGALASTRAHSGLGLPHPAVGFQLYRCERCHTQWTLTPSGWTSDPL